MDLRVLESSPGEPGESGQLFAMTSPDAFTRVSMSFLHQSRCTLALR